MKKLFFVTCGMCALLALVFCPAMVRAELVESFETYSDGGGGYWALPDNGWEDSYNTNLWHIRTDASTEGLQSASWSTADYTFGYSGLLKKFGSSVDFQKMSYDLRVTKMYASSTPSIKVSANYVYPVLSGDQWVDQWYTPGMVVFEGNRLTGLYKVYLNTGSKPTLASDLFPSNDWLHVDQEFDYANELVRARLNGGDWTNWEPWQTYLYPEGGAGQLDSFKLLRYKFSMDVDNINDIPEPGVMMLLATGLAAFLLRRKW